MFCSSFEKQVFFSKFSHALLYFFFRMNPHQAWIQSANRQFGGAFKPLLWRVVLLSSLHTGMVTLMSSHIHIHLLITRNCIHVPDHGERICYRGFTQIKAICMSIHAHTHLSHMIELLLLHVSTHTPLFFVLTFFLFILTQTLIFLVSDML